MAGTSKNRKSGYICKPKAKNVEKLIMFLSKQEDKK